jgi:hypothetical protein
LGNVIDLDKARVSRRAPTRFAAWLAKATGATIVSVSPGHVVATLPDDETVVETRIRRVDVFRKEAEAYRAEGLPVPPPLARPSNR